MKRRLMLILALAAAVVLIGLAAGTTALAGSSPQAKGAWPAGASSAATPTAPSSPTT